MNPLTNVTDLIRHIQNNYENPHALNYQYNGVWHPISTKAFIERVKQLTVALMKLGVKKGDSVGIMALSSPFWTMADLAIMLAGGVCVPLFANISEENFAYEVTQAEVKFLFVSAEEAQWNMYMRHNDLFTKVILIDGPMEGKNALSFQETCEIGALILKQNPDAYLELSEKTKGEDLATIIYTSGSTGIPKGVELTQYNLLSVVHNAIFDWDAKKDRYLSVLPLAHIFGRSLNYIMIGWGVSVYYSNDYKNLGSTCREVHPTLTVVVPRLLEKIYAKMLTNVQNAGYMKRKLGQWAFDLANNEENSLLKHLLHPLADKIVYSALREALGGSLRAVISGGAPLNPHLCHFFYEIGLPIYEGYGLTEASTVCVNRPGKLKIGSVGTAIGEIECKTDDKGEILVRGPIILKRYYKDRDTTVRQLDGEGWFHTGDKGTLDADGFLTIIGRIKELYKTSTGKYIAPVPIEQEICKAPLIDMAMVIAEGRKFASCLVFPNLEVLESLKAAHNQSHLSDQAFLNSEFVRNEMDKLIHNVNTHLNQWEQIHAYRFVPTALSIEAGELTPSMKIVRDVVATKYQHLIEDMYKEEAA